MESSRACIDDIVDSTALKQFNHIVTLVDTADNLNINTEARYCLRRTVSCINLKADIAEFFGKRDNLVLILILNGDKHAAVMVHVVVCASFAKSEARRHKTLKQRLVKTSRKA